MLEVDAEVDLEGDAGVVGRVKGTGPRDLLLDLKGDWPTMIWVYGTLSSALKFSLTHSNFMLY